MFQSGGTYLQRVIRDREFTMTIAQNGRNGLGIIIPLKKSGEKFLLNPALSG
jgi:hypothetical protein